MRPVVDGDYRKCAKRVVPIHAMYLKSMMQRLKQGDVVTNA